MCFVCSVFSFLPKNKVDITFLKYTILVRIILEKNIFITLTNSNVNLYFEARQFKNLEPILKTFALIMLQHKNTLISFDGFENAKCNTKHPSF